MVISDMTIISIKTIDEVTRSVLKASGVPEKSIDIIIDTIHFANRRNMPTHGIGRLPLYVKKIKAGHLNPNDEVSTIVDAGAVAVLDAKGGFGQVAATHALKLAIEKAKQTGIAAVGVRNSNNFGMAGYFGDYAAREGMASLIFANASPAIAPTGGTKRILGTNPLCFAFPGSDANPPIVLDMSTTIVARGKVRLAAKTGEKIPLGWALDAEGNPTEDPNEAILGSLLPIGGYKGYGLALFVDIFAGLLAGSAYAGGVEQLSKMDVFSNNGHLFIVMDTKRFLSEEELKERIDYLYTVVKNCGEDGAVMLPGEAGYYRMNENADTVEIPMKQVEEINELANSLGLDVRLDVI